MILSDKQIRAAIKAGDIVIDPFDERALGSGLLLGANTRDRDARRFWARVDRSIGLGPFGTCWEWTLHRTKLGYGRFRIAGRTELANRIAFLFAKHDPGRLIVMHRCDHPPCCRPGHLVLGTRDDNNRDMAIKRRVAHGENHGMAKLTATQVVEIRQKYAEGNVAQHVLGTQFGVSQTAISVITRGIYWRNSPTRWREKVPL